jgi:hypothetical protein
VKKQSQLQPRLSPLFSNFSVTDTFFYVGGILYSIDNMN